MVRAPCCEKMGLKKGPWSSQEDHILISYIQLHGHGNWRALPKHAGLLRCGKSCRLRWINYLRPDLKRGNFSREEEETIIKLHELLGNRWSVIAARLPGRTDNEIKNVWHTHLKKRVKQSGHNVVVQETSEQPQDEPGDQVTLMSSSEKNDNINEDYRPISPHQSSTISDISLPVYSNCDSSSISDNNNNNASTMADYSPGNSILYEVDDNFWSEAFSTETYDGAFSSEIVDGFSSISDCQELHFPLLEASSYYNYDQNNIDDIWTFGSTATKAGDVSELLY